ncbi:PREDICTED: uncharacterized protein LOC106320944 isoform X1 [Brassica oleracea var. oleracea]|uniref:uncharacterized protein LOC106320944 isoform X1 n=1 Tax=Brassica oleracea var. oleracea TaxID=109376 RepID=UPI0006A6E6C2|nr:PREDICTED: uncharacterized protein LOC106320944 isoform X1 [Brassica oleracea var. oleracea]
MISSHIFLYNLKPSCCSQTVVARLLCFGEARNVKKGGDLMGVDIVLLDDPHCCKGAPASHFQTPSERGRHLRDQWLSCCKNYHPLQAVRFNRSPLKQPMAGSTFNAQNVLGSFSVAYLDSHVHHVTLALYRVEISMTDATDSAVFVLFD